MAAGFNFVELATGPEYVRLGSAVLVGTAVCGVGMLGVSRLRKSESPLIPEQGLSIKSLVELLTEFVFRLGDTAMGEHNRKYLPFLCALFVYLLSLNLLGLVPGFSMPTDHVAFNLGIGLIVFFVYNFWGIKEVGIKAYLAHLWGPIWWVGPLLFVVELISHFVRPLSLSLRLYGNMSGDHLVLGIFTDLTKVVIPVVFYFLGTFVSFMQAFVFTLLTMIYIRFATAHDDAH